jgi:glutamine amidotransferase
MSYVGIVDFKDNNSKAVYNVLTSLGIQAKIVTTKREIANSERMIIPGVGHIQSICHEMDSLDLREVIINYAEKGNFLLGICLGQHLLGKGSEEESSISTLGILDFTVKKIPVDLKKRLRVPHVGWNSIEFEEGHELLRGIKSGSDFYFSHSYAITANTPCSMATSNHSVRFSSIAGSRNVLSVQFHPEKSQDVGRQLLTNFCGL